MRFAFSLLLLCVSTAPAMTINIIAGTGLSSNAAALAAFDRAAAAWTSVLSDPITVNINADLTSAGFANGNIIGQTETIVVTQSYTAVRDALVADVAGSPSEFIVASLPTAAQLSVALPSGYTYTGNVVAAKANLKALGFANLDQTYGSADAIITFNSAFNFRYDNTQSFSGYQEDFETVATHELGHALGFLSSVDDVDYNASTNIDLAPLDFYRFNSAAGLPTNSSQFTTATRDLTPNSADYFSDTTSAYAMSTGYNTGDGRQASHWKDDGLTGTYIGVMDPTLAYNTVESITAADVRALNLIGYNTTATPEPGTLILLGLGLGVLAFRKNAYFTQGR